VKSAAEPRKDSAASNVSGVGPPGLARRHTDPFCADDLGACDGVVFLQYETRNNDFQMYHNGDIVAGKQASGMTNNLSVVEFPADDLFHIDQMLEKIKVWIAHTCFAIDKINKTIIIVYNVDMFEAIRNANGMIEEINRSREILDKAERLDLDDMKFRLTKGFRRNHKIDPLDMWVVAVSYAGHAHRDTVGNSFQRVSGSLKCPLIVMREELKL
jgi:hypothetical protein